MIIWAFRSEVWSFIELWSTVWRECTDGFPRRTKVNLNNLESREVVERCFIIVGKTAKTISHCWKIFVFSPISQVVQLPLGFCFKTHRNVTFMAFLNWGSWHPKSSELRLGQLREFLERHPDKSLFPHKEIGSWRGQDGFGLKEQHLESDSSDARNISNMFERLGGGFRQIFLLWIRLNIKKSSIGLSRPPQKSKPLKLQKIGGCGAEVWWLWHPPGTLQLFIIQPWLKAHDFFLGCNDPSPKRFASFNLYFCTGWATRRPSILEGQPPKTRPKLQSKQGSLWVLGINSFYNTRLAEPESKESENGGHLKGDQFASRIEHHPKTLP